jgi:hypothetical protein
MMGDAYTRVYAEVCVSVVSALRDVGTITDDGLEHLLREQSSDGARKRLVSALLGSRVITHEQAALQVYLRPAMREA